MKEIPFPIPMPIFTEVYNENEAANIPRKNRLSKKEKKTLFREYYTILSNQRIDQLKIPIKRYVARQHILKTFLAQWEEQSIKK